MSAIAKVVPYKYTKQEPAPISNTSVSLSTTASTATSASTAIEEYFIVKIGEIFYCSCSSEDEAKSIAKDLNEGHTFVVPHYENNVLKGWITFENNEIMGYQKEIAPISIKTKIKVRP